MIEAAAWILTACIKGSIICVRDIPSTKRVYYEPEKSCYIEGVFYPRCKDFDDPEVKYYHNLLKGK
jgi:hypothetical protein